MLRFIRYQLFKHFNLYRSEFITTRALVPIKLFDEKYLKNEIDRYILSEKVDKLQKKKEKLVKETKELEQGLSHFKGKVDKELFDLMKQYLELREKLATSKEDLEDIQKMKEDFLNQDSSNKKQKTIKKKPKYEKKTKLYKHLASIYHPDKAPKDKKDLYKDIFIELNEIYRLGDYKALVKFQKRVKQMLFKSKRVSFLRKVLKQLKQEIAMYSKQLEEAKKTEIYKNYIMCKDNPYYMSVYIRKERHKLQRTIEELENIYYSSIRNSITRYEYNIL